MHKQRLISLINAVEINKEIHGCSTCTVYRLDLNLHLPLFIVVAFERPIKKQTAPK